MLGETVRRLWADATSTNDHTDMEAKTDGGTATEAGDPDSSLFQCAECDVVYIALEKERCSSCRTEVDEVSPTLRHG